MLRHAYPLGSDFLFVKMHGMWASAIAGDRLDAMVKAHSLTTLARHLESEGISVQRHADVQRELVRQFLGQVGMLVPMLKPPVAAWYRCLIDRWHVENLKTVLRLYFVPDKTLGQQSLLTESPYLPTIDVERVLAAKSLDGVCRRLPRGPFTDGFVEAVRDVDEHSELLTAECRLDAFYFARFLDASRHLPRGMRRLANTLLRTEIDFLNLVVLLRNVTLYHMPAERMGELAIPGGHLLGRQEIVHLAGQTTPEDVLAGLPREYAALVRSGLGGELHVCENALWSWLYRTAERAFRNFDRPAETLVAYPILKLTEIVNISRLYEGLYFGLGVGDIRNMMVGLP